MAARIDALIEQLSANHPKGFDLSLGRITGLLEKLGNPHLKIPPAFHVAGTNGKGSTLAFLRAILEADGKCTHVHTSPHLVNWNERYRLAGELVRDADLVEATERVIAANDGAQMTIFEIMSAVMFVLFSEHDADFSLVEVGLGGRLDATNMLHNPAACLITPIALDHQVYLGDTIEEIAGEKAGIIKPGAPVFVGEQSDEAREVIESVALRNKCEIKIARQDFDYWEESGRFVFQDEQGLLELPIPALIGEHQMANATLAICAIRNAVPEISDNSIATGMKQVTWPGRFEKLPKGAISDQLGEHANIWIDGGHNPAAGEIVAREIAALNQKQECKTILICGMINTKDPQGYFQAFKGLNVQVMAVPVSMSEASIPPKDLADAARRAGLEERAFSDVKDAITQVRDVTQESRVLFCGSLYFVGEILELNGTAPE